MDEILHHFETMGNHSLLVFAGESDHSKVFWVVPQGILSISSMAFGATASGHRKAHPRFANGSLDLPEDSYMLDVLKASDSTHPLSQLPKPDLLTFWFS